MEILLHGKSVIDLLHPRRHLGRSVWILDYALRTAASQLFVIAASGRYPKCPMAGDDRYDRYAELCITNINGHWAFWIAAIRRTHKKLGSCRSECSINISERTTPSQSRAPAFG
jgi:hypothetical protein